MSLPKSWERRRWRKRRCPSCEENYVGGELVCRLCLCILDDTDELVWETRSPIILTPEQRRNLGDGGVLRCPHCEGVNFTRNVVKLTEHPLFTERPVIRCERCQYWTDIFDGYTWHPPEDLKEAEKDGV